MRRAAGGALSGALGRGRGQHPRGRAGARPRALCERLAQDAVLGKVGFAGVLKGKQLEITRSGQRRVWETRKAAGSVQSTAAFTCLGEGGGPAPRGGARPLRPWKYSSASAWTQVTSAIQELAGPGRTLNFCVPEVPHLQSGRGDHVSLGALGDRDNGKSTRHLAGPRSAGLSFARPSRMLHSRWEEIFQTPSGCPWRCKYTGSGTTRS